MSIGIKLKKGLDLHLAGALPAQSTPSVVKTARVAVTPDDFTGIVPKTEVHEGDIIAAGAPLLRSKGCEELKIVSPASGKVVEIIRGQRRKIERVVVEVAPGEAVRHDVTSVLTSAEHARNFLLVSGLWAMTRQRPYAVVTEPDARIRDIYVTGFDSAPLAWTKESFTPTDISHLETGVRLLSLLTEGKVYVSRRATQQLPDLKGAEMIDVEGPHPASLAGPVIAATRPVNKGETVMTLDIETLARIGQAAATGVVPMTTTVAVTGSEVKHTRLVETLIGAEITALLENELCADGRHKRIISGNVLTGVACGAEGFLRFPYTQLTVIPEGDDVDEFMGWASLSPRKMSMSASFPGHFLAKKLFKPDARLLGGRRAMIMSGEYDKVFPMDILPEYLLKAIIARDIDRMEKLGIYEVAPEDFALAEYADTSKMELQKIVREGLDYMRKELS